jgi:hypothetical protein
MPPGAYRFTVPSPAPTAAAICRWLSPVRSPPPGVAGQCVVIHQIKAAAATNIIPRRTRDAQLLMTAFLSPLPSLAAHRLGSVRLSRLRLSTGII